MKKKKVIVPNIVAGGTAVPLGSNYYLMRGRKHEEGGIDVGANPRTGLEVEDGEVMQLKDKEVRVFSTVPFLNGQSPAQKVMGGENPNKVFAQQEAYKDRNNINDDGTKKAKFGIEDSLEIGKVAASFLPIVGTGIDIYEAIKNPSLSTIGQAGLSLAADLTGLSLVKGIVKTARQVNRINKLRKEADAALTPIKHTMQSLVKTNNPKKIQRAREIGKDWADKYHEYGKALYDFRTRNRNINIATPLYVGLEGVNSVFNYNNMIEDDLQLLNNQKGYGGNHPLNTKYKQKQVIDIKDNNSRTKAKAGLRYILQTNGNSRLGYVPSTGESLSKAKGRDKAELGLFKKVANWVEEHPNTTSDIASAVSNIGGGLTSYFTNKNMLKDLSYDKKPIPRIATKLKTNININPQLDKMRESLANYERNIDANTASSQVGLARKQKARANSLSGYNELYGYKENAETELINKDRLNQQEVANQSIADYNSYIEKKMAFDNAVREKKAENVVSLVNNLASIPSDIISRTDKRRSDALNAALIMARNPNVTPEYLESLGIKLPGNKRKNNKKD